MAGQHHISRSVSSTNKIKESQDEILPSNRSKRFVNHLPIKCLEEATLKMRSVYISLFVLLHKADLCVMRFAA